VDFIILGRYGLAGLGLYTVGSKLYLTILQLLSSALMDVALSALSRISEETARLRQAYLRLIFLASSTTLPLFTLIAALAPEICQVLFGPKWAGADQITMWLCLLGAIQVVQFFNGAALGSTGNARAILLINVTKFMIGAGVLAFFDTKSMSELTMFYVISQLAVSPISFFNAMRATNASLREVLTQISPGFLSSAAAFLVVMWLRSQFSSMSLGVYEQAFYLASTFCLVFLSLLWLSCSRRLIVETKYILSGYSKQT
jgi:O-antigen/teichoic acid export membrane protein